MQLLTTSIGALVSLGKTKLFPISDLCFLIVLKVCLISGIISIIRWLVALIKHILIPLDENLLPDLKSSKDKW